MFYEFVASTYYFLHFGYFDSGILSTNTSQSRVFVVEFIIEMSLESRTL
jgi:hypothetical protein